MKPRVPAGPAGYVMRASRILGSVRLAVVVMATLAAVLIVATFYEARYGTGAAQEHFYRTPWFTALLGLLGASVLFSMLNRWPWNRHHAGFVLAHVGILLLLGGSLFSLHQGLDGRLTLQEGESSSWMRVEGQALTVRLPGAPAVVIPAEFGQGDAHERRFPLSGQRTLVVEQYRSHVSVGHSLAEGEQWNPALYFKLEGSELHEHAWLLAADPEGSHADFGPVVFGFHAARTADDARAFGERMHEGNHLCFLLAPDGRLSYVIGRRQDRTLRRGPVQIGEAIATPWMELAMTASRLLVNAESVRVVTRAPLPKGDGGRRPAVKVRLEGSANTRSDWAVWEEALPIALADGEATITYGSPQAALPFRVTLLDFRSDTYPGSNRPATYQSRVRVEDEERGLSEHVISMNHPLHYRGYTFFQSSFLEGQPMTSILSVSRSPGLPLVYTGTALLSIGVLWMFYLKPVVARRQARRALTARLQPAGGGVPNALRSEA